MTDRDEVGMMLNHLMVQGHLNIDEHLPKPKEHWKQPDKDREFKLNKAQLKRQRKLNKRIEDDKKRVLKA
jgi:hypothetical protein